MMHRLQIYIAVKPSRDAVAQCGLKQLFQFFICVYINALAIAYNIQSSVSLLHNLCRLINYKYRLSYPLKLGCRLNTADNKATFLVA